jgi:hypothetical protein
MTSPRARGLGIDGAGIRDELDVERGVLVKPSLSSEEERSGIRAGRTNDVVRVGVRNGSSSRPLVTGGE